MLADTKPNRQKDLLARLNEEQIEAVCHEWGPALVVAGAGSGKTTVLTRRIAYLEEVLNQDTGSVLAVTFTNKAAQEMKSRIELILGKEKVRGLTIGTFHSICARILRQEIESYETEEGFKWTSNFVIYDEVDSLNIMKGVVKRLNLDEKVFNPKEIKYKISALKNDGYTCQLYSYDAKTYRENRLSEIFNAYQKELAKNNALDFDDLLLVFVDLLKKNNNVRERLRRRFRHVLVDEFQDTNKVQYEMVRLLTYFNTASQEELDNFWNERSLLVVGDVDQSIYSWRKADYRIFLGFQADYQGCKQIKLEENYRSTSTILDVANSIIENNTERIEKVLRCNKGKGARVQYYEAQDEIDEAFYVVEEIKKARGRGRNFNDTVILYRTNAQSRAIEEILMRADIPYKIIGGTRFYDRAEIKDLVAYLKLVYNPKDGQSFNRVVNAPKRGIGKTSLEKLAAYADENGMALTDAALSANKVATIGKRAQKALMEFAYNVTDRWRTEASNSVSGLVELILKDSKYIEALEDAAESKKDELALGRIDNVREFISVAKEFETIADEPDLDSFLTRISLVSDLDQVELEDDAIKLMTIHAAKGLEFPQVFIIGLEEGLFPHSRSLDDPSSLEEERRLMYVAVTRAGDLLYMTRARKRSMLSRGYSSGNSFQSSYTIASRFLKEVTPGLLSGYYPDEEGGYIDEAISSQSEPFDSSFNQGNSFQAENRQKPSYNSNQSNGSPSPYKPKPIGKTKPRAMRMGASTRKATEIGSSTKAYRESMEGDKNAEKLKVGDKVHHKTFGEGEVVAVIGEGANPLYKVKFAEGDFPRTLDPKFAKLIKL